MRLTTRTNLAMRALMFCAVHNDRIVRRHEIASVCNVSENHLAQVVHALGVKGFLQTMRGRAGGLRLGRPMDQISVGEVFRALEAEVPLAECFENGAGTCPLYGACRLTCVLRDALGRFYAHLDGITVADLVEGNVALREVLEPVEVAETA